MTHATAGKTVRIHYTGTLEDGSVFDSSEGRDPLEFIVGSGQIIPGLDRAIDGMATGEQKNRHHPGDRSLWRLSGRSASGCAARPDPGGYSA